MRKALHDVLKQLNQDLIVVGLGAPQNAQLNHDLIVHMRHMGKALHDAIEQLNQDLIVLDVGGCQGAGPGQLTQELIFFNSWINCLPALVQAGLELMYLLVGFRQLAFQLRDAVGCCWILTM